MNEFRGYAARLRRVASGLDRKAARAVDEVGRGALRDARAYAPRESGDLERSLRYRREGTTAVVSTDEFYARFQEYGTSQMAPNPFIGPAAREWGPRLVLEVERIRDGVARDL